MCSTYRASASPRERELRWTRAGRALVGSLLALALALLLGAAAADAFAFKFRGALGWALGAAGDSAERAYSLASLGAALRGVALLEAAYFAHALALPALALAALLALWALPLRRARARALLVACETLFAWAALDVLALALVVALTEISQFAQFIVGDRCDGVNALLAMLDGAPGLPGFNLDGDDVCFDVAVELRAGTWALAAAGVALVAAYAFVTRAARRALHADDRDLASRSARARARRRGACARGAEALRERAIRALLAVRVLEQRDGAPRMTDDDLGEFDAFGNGYALLPDTTARML